MRNEFILIPAYNEGKVLAGVLISLKQAIGIKIIVVDDGSSDNTFAQSRKHADYVLRHAINRGKGAAIKTGLEAAKELNADVVITVDADDQHEVVDIRKILAVSRLNKYDIVLGYRKFDSVRMSIVKRIANRVANVVTWLLYGIRVRDSQCGLRSYSRRAIEYISTQQDKYEYDTEVLSEIKRHGLCYCQVPIRARYTVYSRSKIQKQTIMNGIKMVIRLTILG